MQSSPRGTSICSRCSSRSTCSSRSRSSARWRRPAPLPRAQCQDPVGIVVCVYGCRTRRHCCCSISALRGRGAFLLFFLVIVTAVAQWCRTASRRLRGDRWRDISVAASRGGPGPSGAIVAACVGALLYWITPFKAGQALAMAFIAAGCGTLGRVRDEGAEARRRRLLLGQPQRRHRRGGASRPRRAAVLCRAGVLSLGALVLQAGLAAAMRILGIDPGLQTTGFGVIDADGRACTTWPADDQDRRGGARRPAGAAEDHLRGRLRGGVALRRPLRRVEIVFVNSTRRARCCSAGRARHWPRWCRARSRCRNTPRCR